MLPEEVFLGKQVDCYHRKFNRFYQAQHQEYFDYLEHRELLFIFVLTLTVQLIDAVGDCL